MRIAVTLSGVKANSLTACAATKKYRMFSGDISEKMTSLICRLVRYSGKKRPLIFLARRMGNLTKRPRIDGTDGLVVSRHGDKKTRRLGVLEGRRSLRAALLKWRAKKLPVCLTGNLRLLLKTSAL